MTRPTSAVEQLILALLEERGWRLGKTERRGDDLEVAIECLGDRGGSSSSTRYRTRSIRMA